MIPPEPALAGDAHGRAQFHNFHWLEDTRMYRFILAGAIALSLMITVSVRGDEIVFKNGDHVTGKITKADSGKITITSPVAGTITASMSDVKTFSIDEPATIKMK